MVQLHLLVEEVLHGGDDIGSAMAAHDPFVAAHARESEPRGFSEVFREFTGGAQPANAGSAFKDSKFDEYIEFARRVRALQRSFHRFRAADGIDPAGELERFV